jgi:hypothetical protein
VLWWLPAGFPPVVNCGWDSTPPPQAVAPTVAPATTPQPHKKTKPTASIKYVHEAEEKKVYFFYPALHTVSDESFFYNPD